MMALSKQFGFLYKPDENKYWRVRAEKDELEAKNIFTLRPNVRFEQLTPDDDNAIIAVFHKDNYEDAVEFCLFLLLSGCVAYFNWVKTDYVGKAGKEFLTKETETTYKNFPNKSFSWKFNSDAVGNWYTIEINSQHTKVVEAISNAGGTSLADAFNSGYNKTFIRFFDHDTMIDDVISDCMFTLLTIRNLTEL